MTADLLQKIESDADILKDFTYRLTESFYEDNQIALAQERIAKLRMVISRQRERIAKVRKVVARRKELEKLR